MEQLLLFGMVCLIWESMIAVPSMVVMGICLWRKEANKASERTQISEELSKNERRILAQWDNLLGYNGAKGETADE